METNERVNDTYNSMQMPKVENKAIIIDDYSMCTHSRLLMTLEPVVLCDNILINVVLSVVALTMQILKPAAFIDTAHYPLLLLV